jgi:ribonuclease HI
MTNLLKVASDGSSLKNPGGEIGWAWADEKGRWLANGAPSGTNQTAELLGLISIYLSFPNTNLHLQLDSQYTLNIADKWMYGWQKAGWTRKGNEPLKNLDMVKVIYKLTMDRKEKGLITEFEWVKGHGKNGYVELNDRADIACGLAARRIRDGEIGYLDSAGNTTSPKQDKLLEYLGLMEMKTVEYSYSKKSKK